MLLLYIKTGYSLLGLFELFILLLKLLVHLVESLEPVLVLEDLALELLKHGIKFLVVLLLSKLGA